MKVGRYSVLKCLIAGLYIHFKDDLDQYVSVSSNAVYYEITFVTIRTSLSLNKVSE